MEDRRFGPGPRGRTEDWHPLARWRVTRNLTQAQLAAQAGLDRVTVARIEAGTEPRVVTALRLAHALGVTVEDIWTPDGKPSAALRTAEREHHR